MTGFSPLQHEADGLCAGLPPLMVEADHLAASVSLGVHGRRARRHGRKLLAVPPLCQHDDRRRASTGAQSAKSQHLFVREREWEAAQTVWFWRDGGAEHALRVRRRQQARPRRICCCWRWPRLLVRGGERVGFLGMDGERPRPRAWP